MAYIIRKQTSFRLIARLVVAAIFGMGALTMSAQQDTVNAPDASLCLTANAQAHEDAIQDVHTITVGGGRETVAPRDSGESLIRMFYLDQYRQFHDPEAPHFMFMTNDANLVMGVGGKIFLRGWFDWNGTQDTPDFYPFNIKIPADPADYKGLGGSMSQTRIFFTLIGRRQKLRYQAYLEAGFSDRTFMLRQAYLRLNDFLIGYTYSGFMDLKALIPTVDAQGPNGQLFKRAIQAKYFHSFKSGWGVGASMELPSVQMTPLEGYSENSKSFLPDFSISGEYAWDGGLSHVRLAALTRLMCYRDLVTEKNCNVFGWGVQLSGVYNIIRPLTFYYSAAVGHGIGSYQGDLAMADYDLVADALTPGKMIAPLCMGITGGLQYDFSRRFFACLGFGEAQYYGRKHLNPTDYRYGLYGNANFFWRISPRFLSGIEYIIAKRKDFSGASACSDRLGLLVTFSF